MKTHSCGWRIGKNSLGRRSFGNWGGTWRRGKARMKDEGTQGIESYMDHVANAASFEDFERKKKTSIQQSPEAGLLSAETLPENSSLIDFKAFAQDYPEKLFPLLDRLRPEFQELFVEFYLLQKSQYFIGPAHGFIQTRVWQTLRIIEQMLGSMILLGPEPSAEILRPILRKSGVENTTYGSLTDMILYYAASQSYGVVAQKFHVATPVIRKLFRPIIAKLLADRDVKAVAVGAYLRSLTHWASLTKVGLSKSCISRLRRVKTMRFDAPAVETSPLMSFGRIETLASTPWCMFEISSDHRMAQIGPDLHEQGKRIFGKKPGQIFAPVNDDGELAYGYIFARCSSQSTVRALTRVRGISEMSALCDDEGGFVKAVTIPHDDVQQMVSAFPAPAVPVVHPNDFVEILTGDAARYCGTVVQMNTVTEKMVVEVNFPTGRKFLVAAEPTCVKLLNHVPANKRAFWGTKD